MDKISAEDIEEWEDESGYEFDPNGPSLTDCEYCEALSQYSDQHECGGTRAEDAAAGWYEDAAHGRD